MMMGSGARLRGALDNFAEFVANPDKYKALADRHDAAKAGHAAAAEQHRQAKAAAQATLDEANVKLAEIAKREAALQDRWRELSVEADHLVRDQRDLNARDNEIAKRDEASHKLAQEAVAKMAAADRRLAEAEAREASTHKHEQAVAAQAVKHRAFVQSLGQ
jgi:chromosome segregation ATPase